MKILIIFLFQISFLSWSLAESEPSEQKIDKVYIKVTVASEKDQTTELLLGQILDGKLLLLQKDLTVKVFSLESLSQRRNIKEEIKKAAPVDFLRPSLQHAISSNDIKQCENRPEFKSFLQSLELFGQDLSDFEVTSSNSRFNSCAMKIATILLDKGFRAGVTTGQLQGGGGVSVRAYLKGSAEKTDRHGLKGYQIFLDYNEGAKSSPLYVNADGFFIKSFYPKVKKQNQIKLRVVSPQGESFAFDPEEPPTLKRGIQNTSLFGGDYLEIVSGRYDQVAQVKIPALFLKYATEQEIQKREKQKMSWTYWLSSVHTQGSGLNSATGILPLGVGARYRLNDKVFAQFEGTAPVSIGSAVPSMTHLTMDLSYWIMGSEVLPGVQAERGFKVAGAIGGFFYSARPKEVSDAQYMLSDFLGVSAGLKAFWIFSDLKTHVYVTAMYSPLPQTQVNEFSMSTSYKVGSEYSLNQGNSLYGEFSTFDYNVNYINFGKLDAQISEFRLGYRFLFK